MSLSPSHRRRRDSSAWLSLLSWVLIALCLFALPLSAAPAPLQSATTSAVVTIGDQHVFTIPTSIGPFSAAERAAAASTKLAELTKDSTRNPEDIHPVVHPYSTDIVIGDLVLTTVTQADAEAAARTRADLAASDVLLIRAAILKVRREHSNKSLLLGALFAFLTTVALFVLLTLLRRIFPAIYARIERWRGTYIRALKLQSLEIVSEERLADAVLHLVRILRLTVTILLLYFYIPLVFSFFPQTRSYGAVLLGYIISPIRSGWLALTAYLPNLLVVFVIGFFAYLALRVARFFFRGLERGSIAWPGFYPEWASPTLKIVQLLIVAFAVVIAFPYLPGSSSPAFKGVTIFLGVLFSLGSSSTVANIVAGVLLTYTRAFQLGDRVQIADSTGDVVAKSLLATQIRTIKNVVVTIPNSLVLGSHIINFSSSSKAHPLILHVTVSIGYDAPWRQVHTLLIAAATRTSGILADPAPFVLQTSLDDFYVSYQINAYTDQPASMANIYSDLNQNIQDQFNEAGVEIMSPHFSSLRDGNATAIPASYLPSNYEPNPFRVSAPNSPRSTPK